MPIGSSTLAGLCFCSLGALTTEVLQVDSKFVNFETSTTVGTFDLVRGMKFYVINSYVNLCRLGIEWW